MHLLLRRYSRSGYASAWYFYLVAIAFVALAVWAVVAGDWLALTLAIVMAAVALALLPIARRLAEGLRESNAALDRERNERDA